MKKKFYVSMWPALEALKNYYTSAPRQLKKWRFTCNFKAPLKNMQYLLMLLTRIR